MTTMLSASRSSPRSPKRRRDEEEELEAPQHLLEPMASINKEHDGEDDFESARPVPDCEATNSFSTPLRTRTTNSKTSSSPASLASTTRLSSPACSSNESLSEAGTSTPLGLRPSPGMAFAALKDNQGPPKKRPKLTAMERDEQKMLRAVRDQEKAEERAKRAQKKKAKDEDKARKDAEKDEERRRRNVEREEKRLAKDKENLEREKKRLEKEASRAEKDEEKRIKEDEKKRKEEEKQKMEEEKKRKERAQPTLNAFFKKPSTSTKGVGLQKSPSPAPGATTPPASVSVAKSPCKLDSVPEYQKRFPSFFVQSHVKVAPFTQFGRDKRASTTLQDTIDSYIHGQRSPEKKRDYDPVRLFNQSHLAFQARGRVNTPVREIISNILGNAKQPIDLTTDSQNIRIQNTRDLLRKVPYKILSFAEDVRPPYKGTYTRQPMSGMRKMARKPTSRDLPHVNYDYDSEAEWEDEDGEDVESDCDDDEEAADAGEDLEEFLDDAEVETLNARKLVMQGDMEPQCSGLCWEDQKRRGPNVKLYRYLMEVISEDRQITFPIDPLATHYWKAPAPTGLMEPPRIPLNAIKSTSAGMNGPNHKATNPFSTAGETKKSATKGSSSSTVAAAAAAQRPKKVALVDDMPAFKRAVQGNELSKVGLIEVLYKQFPKSSKASIKYTLESVAERVGTTAAEKRWVLVEEGGGKQR